MNIHPCANALPDMSDEEFDLLVEDIRCRGLLIPIELLDGEIIDGRHRHLACKAANCKPRFVNVDLGDSTAAEYVWALNGVRRHLTASQRACVALELMPECRREAKERQKKSLLLTQTTKGQELIPDPSGNGQARDDAAEIVGVNPHYVSDAESIKKADRDLYADVQGGSLTISKAKKQIKETVKSEADRKSTAKAKRALPKNDDFGVYHGDSFKLANVIPDESCPLIFTDPPYDRKSLPMYRDLGQLANRILVDGGSLITYCPKHSLLEVGAMLAEADDMRFFWICASHHMSGSYLRMTEYGIVVRWNPMLWFVKGSFRRDRQTWVEDLVSDPREKDHHDWQQPLGDAEHFIERLSKKDELVVDPFCGGGTTAVACRNLRRTWWTADIEERNVIVARKRLS